MTRFARTLLLFCLAYTCMAPVFAQFGLSTGINYFQARNHTLVGDIHPRPNIQLGANWTFPAFSSIERLAFKAEAAIIGKGYRQTIQNETFSTSFTYFGLLPSLHYGFSNVIGIHTGLELNFLMSTNNQNGISLFRNFEGAAFLGLDILPKKTLSYYIRASYGLTPVLEYPNFDPIQGIIGESKNLFLVGLMIGVQYNLNKQ